MSNPARTPAPFRLTDGAIRVFAAELLLLPTGLITAAVLTRRLGPSAYGLFTLAATLITWVAGTTNALLARAAVKYVSEAEQWEPVARSVLRWRFLIGAAAMLGVLIAASSIAHVLGANELAPYLRVFSVDLLLFNLARAHREVLTGIGRFRAVSVLSMVRWISRMILVVVLVMVSGSVMAAVIACVGATLLELLVAVRMQPLGVRGPGGVPAADMWTLAAPLMVYGAAIQLYTKVDLFALSALGSSTRDTGLYGAAQNLAVAPGLFVLAFTPLLLATLGQLGRQGEHSQARVVGRTALRVTIALVPLAAIVAAAAPEIVRIIFGRSFVAAGPLFSLLFASAVALAITAVSMAIVTAADRPRLVSVLGVVVLVVAFGGHLLFIPRFGAIGAARVTLVSGALGSLVGLAMVHRLWGVHAYSTLLRATAVAVPAYWLTSLVGTAGGVILALKLLLLSIGSIAGVAALGELSAVEWLRIRAMMPRWRRAATDPSSGPTATARPSVTPVPARSAATHPRAAALDSSPRAVPPAGRTRRR